MKLVESLHDRHIANRRARVLAGHLAPLLPRGGRVLDVGCGDGVIASLIAQQRSDVTLCGVDVLVRESARIAVQAFDGAVLPFADGTFDSVMLVDVLHHTEDPLVLLREARRIARHSIVLKDHLRTGPLAGVTLRLMDYVGNHRHGVALPYNYWTRRQWQDAFDLLGWNPAVWEPRLNLYGWPAGLVFDRSLHFVASLRPSAAQDTTENSRVMAERG